jgi:hypothetical protein
MQSSFHVLGGFVPGSPTDTKTAVAQILYIKWHLYKIAHPPVYFKSSVDNTMCMPII